jgi:hypothetical protein
MSAGKSPLFCAGTCTFHYDPKTGWSKVATSCVGANCNCPPKPTDTPSQPTVRILACVGGSGRLARTAKARVEIGPRVSLEVIRYPTDPQKVDRAEEKTGKRAVTR